MIQKDVFLNIAGGLKVNDPAIDLPVISAILSSNMDAAIEPEVCMAGEIRIVGRDTSCESNRTTYRLKPRNWVLNGSCCQNIICKGSIPKN